MGEEITTKVSFVAGKTDGLKVVEQTSDAVTQARKELAAIKKTGGLENVAGGKGAIKRATAEIELMNVQLERSKQQSIEAVKALMEADEGSAAWIEATNDIARADLETAKLEQSLERVTAELGKMGDKAVAEAEKSARALEKAADKAGAYGTKLGSVRDQTESLGDADSALMALSGLAGGVGLGGVAGGLTFGSDVLATAEAIPKLNVAIVEMGKKAQALPGVLGAVSTAAAGATAGAGGTAAAMSAMAVAAAPFVLAAGAAGGAFLALTTAMTAGDKAAQDALEARRRVVENELSMADIRETMSREQIQDDLESLKIREQILIDGRNAEIKTMREMQGTWDRHRASMGWGGPYKAASEELDKLNETIDENINQQELYNRALEEGAYTTEDATAAVDGWGDTVEKWRAEQEAAEAEASAARMVAIGEIREVAALEQARAETLRDATVEQVEGEIQAIEDLISQRKLEVAALRRASDGSEEYTKAIDDTQAALDAHKEQLTFLKEDALSAAQATDAQAQASEAAADAEKELEAGRKKAASLTERLAKDETRIAQQKTDKLADIERKHADKLIDISRNAARAAEDALQDLEQARRDIGRDAVRDEAKAQRDAKQAVFDNQIKAQRTEAKALRDHTRSLEKIKRDATDREFIMIANRDFAALFESRMGTKRRTAEAVGGFGVAQTERQIATGEGATDLRRQLEAERNERQIALQQSLQDARSAYEQERAEANVSRRRSADDANIARARERKETLRKAEADLKIKRDTINTELNLIAQGANARLQMEANAQQAMIAMAQRSASAIIQMAQSMAGITQQQGVNMSQQFYITGRDPEGTARMVDQRVNRTLSHVMSGRSRR